MSVKKRAAVLFAGLGGSSEGARRAGIETVWVGNHWKLAVDTHRRNHPDAVHACQDLHQADWASVPEHDILLASPCCQGHSKARGMAHGNPQHDTSRSTAWAVVSALECHRTPVAVVENVPEFLDWTLYPAWAAALQALGYSLAPHIIDAADHGVPQHRRRLYLIATRSRAPLHLRLPKRPHVPAASIIDFSAGSWSPVNKPGRSPRTLARIQRGRLQHGDRFVAPYYGSGSGETGRSLQRPLGTVTTRDRWAVIDGERMRMMTVDEYRAAMGFPVGYLLPPVRSQAIHLLGNADSPPVQADVCTAILAQA